MILPLQFQAMNSVQMGGLPGLELAGLMELLVSYFLASLRIGAFMLSAPLLGARFVPVQIRIILGFALGLVVASQTSLPDPQIATQLSGLVVILSEIAIGLSAGLTLTVLFSAVLLAGEKIATSSGLGFAAQMDPNSGGQTPVVSQMLYLFMIVLFVSLDGHLIAIRLMLESYSAMPIGFQPTIGVMIKSVLDAAGQMFFAAAMIMLPVALVMLMINAAIGIITRSAPQLNLFSFGFPISLLGVFFVLYISTDSLGFAFADLIDKGSGALELLLGGLANG